MHILPNISRIKDSGTIKYCQLIEYNVRNIFLEKSCKKCGEETITRPLKNQEIKIGHISGSIV